MSSKTAILTFTEHQSPADRGRMAHVLTLADQLQAAGHPVRIVFAGKSVEWLPQLTNPERSSEHPFVQNYGPVFDRVRAHVHTCNFCNRRFGTLEAVQAAGIEVLGEGMEHMDHTWLHTEGWRVITI